MHSRSRHRAPCDLSQPAAGPHILLTSMRPSTRYRDDDVSTGPAAAASTQADGAHTSTSQAKINILGEPAWFEGGVGVSGSLIRTPDQRLRVFVSSTLAELAAERAAAREAIERLQLTPVLFELGARPHPPRDLYRAYLEQSQIFVGIYWQRYGWVAPDETVSGLEDEYSLSVGMPRLLYVKAPAPDREERLVKLLGRIQSDDTASYKPFQTPEELARLVSADLALLLSERFMSITTASNDHPLPVPDRPHHNLPVQLTSLIGREAELSTVKRAPCRLTSGDPDRCRRRRQVPPGSAGSR